MIPITDQLPSGAIVIPSGEQSRYVLFELCKDNIQVPTGSACYRVWGPSVSRNRNAALKGGLEEWYWFLDDDHTFDPDILLRLLIRNVPVVAALTVFKRPPFEPVLFSGVVPHPDGAPAFQQIQWKDLIGKTGLFPVFACNATGMLVRKEVLEKVPLPFQVGRYNPEILHEDMYFCEQLRNAGFSILVDLDVWMGHIAPVAAKPLRDVDGHWRIELDWGPLAPRISYTVA